MHPDLARAADAIRTATTGLTPAQLAWQPPGRWSAAEILEHLGKTYSTTAYILRRCLDEGVPKARPDTFSQRLFARVVVGLGFMPSGRRAPDFTTPAGLAPEQAVSTALAHLETMDGAVAACEVRFGARTPLANHPVLGALDAGQWRRFHLVHTRHHAKQIVRRGRQGRI